MIVSDRVKEGRNRLRDDINQRVLCTDLLEKAERGGYICPHCGSGSHKNKTGAVKYYKNTNTCACHACPEGDKKARNFDSVDLIQYKYNCDYNTALKLGADMIGANYDDYVISDDQRINEGWKQHKEKTDEADRVLSEQEKQNAILNKAFKQWYNSQEIDKDIQNKISDFDSDFIFDTRQDFFYKCGYVDQSGNITEIGEKALKATESLQNDSASADDKNQAADVESQQTGAQEPTGAAVEDYTEYYKQCCRNLKNSEGSSYLQARGISYKTAIKCYVGYDAEWISPTVIKSKQAEGSEWRPPATERIIMPVSKNHYVARAIDPSIKEYAKMNETGGGNVGVFNARILRGDDKVIFVTEGIFDALSIMECGAAAVAINSTSNADLFVKEVKERQAQAIFVLCLDNDDAGKKAAAKIKQGLTGLNISYVTADICGGFKDPNEALTGDKAAFEKAIAEAQKKALTGEPLPGLLTYYDAVNIFEKADDRTIELKSFSTFSKTAKIKRHDSIVIAADTGAGKSSLAINFLNDLNNDYPCIYINLEMDSIDVLRRLTSIYSGIELDRIEGYKHDEKTAEAVNISLKAITSRKPLQVIQGAYLLQDIENIIKHSTQDREEPTAVFIDHSLLIDTKRTTAGRYDRFTQVSEGLRKMALKYNIILFVLLQQNRSGKADDTERPKNSSLKESGSWENDATQICFLWYDPTDKRKKLLLTKNRHGSTGEFTLNYWKKTQTYTEATENAQNAQPAAVTHRPTKREKARRKLENAYREAYITTGGKPTIRAMAEAADVTTNTIKSWVKEHGGCTIDGKPQDPAGIDTTVEYTGFIKLTPADSENPFDQPAGNGQKVTARY